MGSPDSGVISRSYYCTLKAKENRLYIQHERIGQGSFILAALLLIWPFVYLLELQRICLFKVEILWRPVWSLQGLVLRSNLPRLPLFVELKHGRLGKYLLPNSPPRPRRHVVRSSCELVLVKLPRDDHGAFRGLQLALPSRGFWQFLPLRKTL